MTEISRRALLRAGVAGVALAPFVSIGDAVAAPAPVNLYTRGRFVPHLNAAFQMVSATKTWSSTLIRISDLQPVVVSGDQYRFRLTFRTTGAGPPQGLYTFRRSGFSATAMFVVPSDANRRFYQAVINRAP